MSRGRSTAVGAAWTTGVLASVTLLILGATQSWTPWAEPPAPPAAAGPLRIMPAGDSITQGSTGRHTWRYRLWKHLQSSGAHVDFVGPRRDVYDQTVNRGGSLAYADPAFDADHDAIWGRRLAEAATTIEEEVRTARPDHLLVLLGINDLMKGAGAAATEASLVRYIENARRGNERISIILGTPLPAVVTGTVPDLTAQINDYAARLNTVAARSGTPLSAVRVAQTAKDVIPAEDLYDGLHPNARGEVKIAAGFAAALSTGFGVGGPYVAPVTSEVPARGAARAARARRGRRV